MGEKKCKCCGGVMRVRAYPVLCNDIETGIDYAWMRAHKHTDTPTEGAIKAAMYEGVMGQICEDFEFDDEVEDDIIEEEG